jgi:rieske iron-sulfur protein
MVGTGTTGMAVSRRSLLEHGGIAAAAMILPAGSKPDEMAGPQIGDIFVTAADLQGPPVQFGEIRAAAPPILAWPRDPETGLARSGTRLNQVLLLHVGDANGWQGQILAFSAICPHAACLVSQWIRSTNHLRCPCHGSEFDPAHAGIIVVDPSPFPLSLLPVETVKDLVTVAGPFSAPPGGHTSRTM